jgi:aldose 1-epimerase
MEVFTDQPAMQFYSGNFFDGKSEGKYGKALRYRESIALETQKYPDTPNHPEFPSTLLNPGEKYVHKCVYRFSVK